RQRDEQEPGNAAHGRDVAEVGHGGLVAELPVAGERQVEVNAFGEEIGGGQDDAARPGLQDRGVVSDAREDRCLHAVRDRCRPTEAPDQFELADPALAHQWRLDGAAATGRRLIVERRDGAADLAWTPRRAGTRRRAELRTSSIVSAKMKVIPLRRCLGMSARSFSFFLGRITLKMPTRLAARIFSLSPPICRTRPRSVTSPVMAMSWPTGVLVRAEASAVAMVIPAEGPSLGIAPAGTWMWMSCLAKTPGLMPSCRSRERT